MLADALGLDIEVTDADEAGVRVARRHEARPTAVLDERYRHYRELIDALRSPKARKEG